MKTRRQFLTQTLKGIACLSSIAFLGMKGIPETKRQNWDSVWKDITEMMHDPNWPDRNLWALKPGGILHYNGRLSQNGIMYFTAPTRGQG